MRPGVAIAALLALAACQGGKTSLGLLGKGAPEGAATGNEPIAPDLQATGGNDVEAPGVFKLTDKALWDGRPSLGGVWVAHTKVQDPERVLITNTTNGKSVIGALFRREIDNPGPSIQLSSDAAEALGMLAGQPATVNIVALRRVEPEPAPAAAPAAPEATAVATAGATKPAEGGAIKSSKIDPIATTAAAAIDKATKAKTAKAGTKGVQPAAPPGATRPAKTQTAAQPATPAPSAAALKRAYVQIGIFSVEANANKAAAQMQKAGLAATVKPDKAKGKTFWRVIIGPAVSVAERDALAARVKGLGYPDSYAVSN